MRKSGAFSKKFTFGDDIIEDDRIYLRKPDLEDPKEDSVKMGLGTYDRSFNCKISFLTIIESFSDLQPLGERVESPF